MSLGETIMSDTPSGGIEVTLARMEGKMDRMNDRLERYEHDQQAIRVRMHDLANTIQPLIVLDLPARIRTADQDKAKTDQRLIALENVEQQRKGAAQLAKLLWAIGGAVGVSGAAAIVALLKGVI